jgi:hypothetical protein
LADPQDRVSLRTPTIVSSETREDVGDEPHATSDLQRAFVDRVRVEVAKRRADPLTKAVVDEVSNVVQPGQWTAELARPRGALARLEQAGRGFAFEAPVESSHRLGRPAKAVLNRVMQWYVGALLNQLRTYSRAETEFGRSVLGAIDDVMIRLHAVEDAVRPPDGGQDGGRPSTS